MSLLDDLLGESLDDLFQDIGINHILVRYNGGNPIIPTPQVWNKGPETKPEISTGFSTNITAETLNSYEVRIVKSAFESQLQLTETVSDALRPKAEWQISEDNGTTWKSMKLLGTIKNTPAHYLLELVPKGIS